MSRWALTAVILGLIASGGCNTSRRYDTSMPVVEEFNPPPNEERYNNPPESGYRKPPPKKEMNIRQGIGPQGPGMGGGPGMGAPGMNGMAMPGRQ